MTYENACYRKVRYSSRKEAKLAMKRMKGRGNGREGHLMAYACEHCDFWHLGHLSPSVFRGVITKDEWAR